MKTIITILSILFAFNVAAQLPDGYSIESVNTDYNSPIDVEFVSDGQYMVVAERAGLIWVEDLIDGVYIKRGEPIIDISNEVTASGERGVQSIVVNSAYIWIYYTVNPVFTYGEGTEEDSQTFNRVTRYEWGLPTNFSTNRTVIIGTTPHDGIAALRFNHNGGGMTMANGYLFISTGDDGVSSNSQLQQSDNGKVWRVYPFNGDAPPSNPFYNANGPRSSRSRMWAMGLRNPFDITSDSEGNIVIADVGGGFKEEISVIRSGVSGLNLGWPAFEGMRINNTQNDSLIQATSFEIDADPAQRKYTHYNPDIDYSHNNTDPLTRLVNYFNGEFSEDIDQNPIHGNSITGGCFIEGDGFGAKYNGAYIFSDWTKGWLNVAFRGDGDRFFEYTENFAPDNTVGSAVDITQHPDGSIYIVRLFGGIYRIWYDDSLSVPKFEFNYKLASKTYYDILGREWKTLDYVPYGIYIVKYEYQNRIETKKTVKTKQTF